MTTPTDAHRLIFCINAGRSGSKYLSRVLSSARHTMSFHEAKPTMSGEYLHWINQYPYEETFERRKIKVEAIQEILSSSPKEKIYCETSHMFIKTFFDVAVDAFGTQMEVIVLRRNLASMLKSFLELGYFSEKNNVWKKWMSSPNAVTAAIPCIDTDDRLDPCDRSIAYLIDIEARAQRFCQTYPQIKVHSVQIDSFNQLDFVLDFFEQIRLVPTKKTDTIYSKTFNTRSKRKEQIDYTVDIAYCRDRIDAYIKLAKEQGIQIPCSLVL